MKLTEMRCVPCEMGTPPMDKAQVAKFMKKLPKGWTANGISSISKQFKFKTYPDTISFVNKVALIAQEEGHHPDLQVGYSKVIVEFSTHSIRGLSENDFVMAAKIEG